MAYGNYPNYYNNPYQQNYYQPYQQPQYQPIQQPVQAQSYSPAIMQNGIIWISGEQEAAMYPIAPNNAVALWEKSGKTIYLKSADATGKPTMRVYDLVERAQAASDGGSEQGDKPPAYATKDELSAVAGIIGTIKSEVDTIRTDLYGLAGKKKTAARKPVTEVTDDDE